MTEAVASASEPTLEALIDAGLIRRLATKPKSNPKAEAMRLEAIEIAKRRFTQNAATNTRVLQAVEKSTGLEPLRGKLAKVSASALGARLGREGQARHSVQTVFERLGVDVGRKEFLPPKLPECVTRAKRKRNLRIDRATPKWADLAAIDAVYAERDRLTAETGIPHHVDHIYPIAGATVSGLHVHQNLRAIPAQVNVKKGNKTL